MNKMQVLHLHIFPFSRGFNPEFVNFYSIGNETDIVHFEFVFYEVC